VRSVYFAFFNAMFVTPSPNLPPMNRMTPDAL
jgi:hypothetical protein